MSSLDVVCNVPVGVLRERSQDLHTSRRYYGDLVLVEGTAVPVEQHLEASLQHCFGFLTAHGGVLVIGCSQQRLGGGGGGGGGG